ncbi:ATP-binding protein [Marinicella sediminis]|uniref:ATP-binding protein n=1 Tax=Marinicella sediminis TaxID=1792834 RepID=A0ABV7J557_9GAMM|nr:ATP-binding protein [Marinicella sediminis]
MNAEFDEHPIFNNSQFFIMTPMIQTLSTQINKCLWNGSAGAAVYGDYRLGKTRALDYLIDILMNRQGEKIGAKSISIAPRDQNTIAGIFKNICHSFGFELKARATSDDMSNIVMHHLGDLTLINSTKQVVLIVDEFQRLNVNQLEAFAELYDGLVRCGANLFVLFAGNDSDSLRIRKSIQDDQNELIRGRFFTQEFMFYGIRTYEELVFCLNEFDTRQYPKDGPTYTKYFVGNTVPDNWRLKSLADNIWPIYLSDFKSQMNIKSWPMQYFISMIRILLTDFLPNHGVGDDGLISEMIRESIRASGLVKNLVH